MKISTSIAAVMAIAGVAVNAEHTSRKLIVGAHPIKRGTKTYTVGLRDTIDGYSFCGAVLVAPKLVATVTSCVEGPTPKFVAVGTHYLNQTLDGEQIEVASILIHPKNNPSINSYDFALVKLTKPSQFKPISLPEADDSDLQANMKATAMGWGRPNFPDSDALLGVNMKVWGDRVCKAKEGVDKTNLCASGATRDGACILSNGGPLVKEQTEGNKNDILIGLTVWGRGCGKEGYPAVFSRVSAAISWINLIKAST